METAINKTNEQEIVAKLAKAAGRAIYTTIRDWEAFEKAFNTVLLDIERRFCVPEGVNMRAIYTAEGRTANVTELTFSRTGGVWYFEKARNKRTSSPRYIKYEVCSYSYEKFWLYVKDGRSMKSVELKDNRVLSAHEKLTVLALQAQRLKSRVSTKR